METDLPTIKNTPETIHKRKTHTQFFDFFDEMLEFLKKIRSLNLKGKMENLQAKKNVVEKHTFSKKPFFCKLEI